MDDEIQEKLEEVPRQGWRNAHEDYGPIKRGVGYQIIQKGPDFFKVNSGGTPVFVPSYVFQENN